MLVYGDPQFEESPAIVISRLRAEILTSHGKTIEEVRRLLVRAGQLEQAIADSEAGPDILKSASQCTDALASALLAAWESPVSSNSPPEVSDRLEQAARGSRSVQRMGR